MKKPTRIFLDIDDVLNKFTMHALRHVGCPVDTNDASAYKPEWGWDIIKAANELNPRRFFTESTFWFSIKRGFWSNIPISDEYNDLLEMCQEFVFRKDICLLSSPTLDPDCLAGKLEWIHRFMPKWIHRQYLIGPPKHMCAQKGALLIDDREKNVVDFRNNGGEAILMPRKWNCLHEVIDPGGYLSARLHNIWCEGAA